MQWELTFDIDPRLNPDIEGSITENDLSDEFVDTVLCCQVLEHIPWEKVPTALSQIHRVAKLGAVISVPNVTRVASIRYFSSKRASARQYRLPFFKRTGQDIKVQNDFHYWELGANISEREFETLLEAQFNIKHSLRTYERESISSVLRPYKKLVCLSCGKAVLGRFDCDLQTNFHLE